MPRFVLLPRNGASSSQVYGPTRAIEHALRVEGYPVQRMRRHDMPDNFLEDMDVVLVEIGDNEDLAFCAEVRTRSQKPLLLYGWDIPSSIWIKGLDVGADAFLSLPTEERVLRAQLHAVLRRSGLNLLSAVWSIAWNWKFQT